MEAQPGVYYGHPTPRQVVEDEGWRRLRAQTAKGKAASGERSDLKGGEHGYGVRSRVAEIGDAYVLLWWCSTGHVPVVAFEGALEQLPLGSRQGTVSPGEQQCKHLETLFEVGLSGQRVLKWSGKGKRHLRALQEAVRQGHHEGTVRRFTVPAHPSHRDEGDTAHPETEKCRLPLKCDMTQHVLLADLAPGTLYHLRYRPVLEDADYRPTAWRSVHLATQGALEIIRVLAKSDSTVVTTHTRIQLADSPQHSDPLAGLAYRGLPLLLPGDLAWSFQGRIASIPEYSYSMLPPSRDPRCLEIGGLSGGTSYILQLRSISEATGLAGRWTSPCFFTTHDFRAKGLAR
eukprot:Sspe_Gene.60978::Locus_33714_Transcript_1_1_Confidence_1.000_Length_1716::g.60978::m.60978